MKLKYFTNNKNKKVYTLNEETLEGKKKTKTKDAHYKFIKVRNAPRSEN